MPTASTPTSRVRSRALLALLLLAAALLVSVSVAGADTSSTGYFPLPITTGHVQLGQLLPYGENVSCPAQASKPGTHAPYPCPNAHVVLVRPGRRYYLVEVRSRYDARTGKLSRSLTTRALKVQRGVRVCSLPWFCETVSAPAVVVPVIELGTSSTGITTDERAVVDSSGHIVVGTLLPEHLRDQAAWVVQSVRTGELSVSGNTRDLRVIVRVPRVGTLSGENASLETASITNNREPRYRLPSLHPVRSLSGAYQAAWSLHLGAAPFTDGFPWHILKVEVPALVPDLTFNLDPNAAPVRVKGVLMPRLVKRDARLTTAAVAVLVHPTASGAVETEVVKPGSAMDPEVWFVSPVVTGAE